MKNFVKIYDLVSFNLIEATSVKDSLPMMTTSVDGQPAKGLLVKIAASHAGILTKNNMFYLPEKMKTGVKTFTDGYAKPILLNHDTDLPPIGRVREANYIDTSHIVKDKLTAGKIKDSKITSTLIEDFCNGKMSEGAQIDAVRMLFNDSLLDDPAYAGLGYAEIVAQITDKEAIERFLDGRYLTGSVGAATDRATCSVCKNDWTKEGPCEHRPGKIYDSKKAFLIMGNFTYEEYSVVSKPADGHSKVIEVYFNGIRDSIDLTDSEFSGRIPEIILQFPKEIRQMPSGEVKDTEQVKTEEVKDQQVTESFDDLVTRILDSEKTPELSDLDDEKLYQLMLDEMKSIGLTEKEIEDAKLSTDKRKSLPKTSFCAPNRAFPVPDCAHVTAARRLIGKYKGPGDKTAILACVERKAKAMSCGTVKDETDKESNLPESVKTMQTLSPEDFKKTLDAVLELAKQKDPKVIRDLVKLEEPALVQEVVALEVKMGTLLDELKQAKEAHAALLEENKLVASEAAVLQDSLLKNKSELRNGKVKFASLLKSLKAGNPLSKEDEDKLLSLEDQVLSSELENLTKEVDIKKITDKLNDGTSRNPSGTVESPSGNQAAPKFTVEDTKKELKRIQEKYLEMKFQNSYTAERWKKVQLERMIKEGKITIETAQKIV